MKHRVFGKRLSRDTKGRKALIKSLVAALVQNERIVTTIPRAKILKSVIDKLINRAKEQTLFARRYIIAQVSNQQIAAKIFDDLAPRFSDRISGYTRSVKLGPRSSDQAEMSIVEFVQFANKKAALKLKKTAKTDKKLQVKSEKQIKSEKMVESKGGKSGKRSKTKIG